MHSNIQSVFDYEVEELSSVGLEFCAGVDVVEKSRSEDCNVFSREARYGKWRDGPRLEDFVREGVCPRDGRWGVRRKRIRTEFP